MKDFDGNCERGNEPRVTLPELLRLKRHERPPAEFWEDFDVLLKERAFQSVVRKKSWVSGFSASFFNAWTLRLSAGLAALALVAMYFISPAEETTVVGQEVVSSSLLVTDVATVVLVVPIEASDEVEFIDGALTLSDSGPAEFDIAFPTNDLRVASSDSVTYAEESLTTLLAESLPSDRRAIF